MLGWAVPAAGAVTLTKVQDLKFHPAVAGDPAGTVVPATDKGVAAQFNIAGGTPLTPYNINLPNGNQNMTGPGANIAANTWTSSPVNSDELNAQGAGTFYVGATHAALAAGQTAGTYTSGPVTISIKHGNATPSTTFTASIVVTSSIAIVKVSDLSFPDCAPGDAARALTAGSTGSAQFTVSGGANLSYSITFPASINMTGPGGATIAVSTFTSSPASPAALGGSGTSTLYVGATRGATAAGQTAGSYSGSFTVTVAYY
jgi:hypothetical protein